MDDLRRFGGLNRFKCMGVSKEIRVRRMPMMGHNGNVIVGLILLKGSQARSFLHPYPLSYSLSRGGCKVGCSYVKQINQRIHQSYIRIGFAL